MEQLILNLGHNEARTSDDFLVYAGNRVAFDHIMAFPDWPGPLTVLVGTPKSGKSHLARIWLDHADAIAIDARTIGAVAAEGGGRPVLVEDADRAGYAETELFHLLNQSIRAERPVLLTARAPVADWPFRTDDLKSRARLAQHFSLTVPDDILLSQMFVKLFADRQLSVDPKVVSYLLDRMERSSEEVVALVDLMDRLSLSRGRAITRGLAAQALAARTSERQKYP